MIRNAIRSLGLLLVATVSLGALSACARNPATGELQLSFIGENREIQMGRQADESIVRSMGVYESEELESSVSELGRRMAAVSERPDLPWTFRVVDEPVVNAFALPGGFVYMTRGILVHFNSEAQLAAVLGHEIGHVTARHSVNQMSRQQLATIGLGVGSILSPEVAQFQGLISSGMQLAFLKFSRDDESQSDELGLRYMTAVGYDPTEMAGVFRMLGRASGGGGERAPEWLSTHPDPENREDRIRERIAELEIDPDTMTVDREEYLRMLEGVVFGPDPRNGYFQESTFLHPDLRFRFDFPAGWRTVNQAESVAGQSPEGDAIVGLRLAEEASAEAALDAFARESGARIEGRRGRPVNDLPASWAAFRVETQQGVLAGLVAFVEYGDRVYQLQGFTPEARFGSYRRVFEESFLSFDRLDDPDLLSVEPKRIELVELPEAMTLTEFDERYPSTVGLDRLAVLNQVDEVEPMEAGRLVKRVRGEGPPGSP